MKQFIYALILGVIILTSCTQKEQNPFFSDYNTPFETPAFDKIKSAHFMPAFKEGIKQNQEEIKAIVNNPAPADFNNTIVALERSGKLLTKVSNVFFALHGADTNVELQAIAKEVTPLLSRNNDDIKLNEGLFKRIKTVYDVMAASGLTAEQQRLVNKYYQRFVRGGANLGGKDKETFRAINQQLSMLGLQFGENVLKENNRFEMLLENKEELSGLPKNVIAAAADAAKAHGYEGKWLFTLHKPSLIPFLQYSQKRALREKMFTGYITRGDHDDELDNKKILTKMAALRVKRAHLLGYKTHADFVLENIMAKNPANVYKLLDQVWTPALNKAKEEAKDLQKMIYASGEKFELKPWDWWYYAEKLKKQKYDLDEEMLRPYFKLEHVRDGAFEVAHRLYGITFSERHDIPVYEKDVKTFEVKNADGSHVGILYVDYFPRAGKQGGAWMEALRKQSRLDGKAVTPIIYNVGNFSKPTGDKPSLLSLDEVLTLFHEFGHGLHGLLSNGTYPSLTGTSVARDFVELPSQFMENFATAPKVLKQYAKHYKTGDPMPDDLIDKIQRSGHFNQGFATTEFMAAAYLDMDWHTIADTVLRDAHTFENASMKKIGLIPEIVVRYRSPYFSHIFSGDYSSGYYSYLWAEVLDADAFEDFKEHGLFDSKTAQVFRDNILAKGDSEDPIVLYKRFRGQEPQIEPLLKRRGLK